MSVMLNELSFVSYDVSKVCDQCHIIQPPGNDFMVITCVCGCDELERTCMMCPPDHRSSCSRDKSKQNGEKMALITFWF